MILPPPIAESVIIGVNKSANQINLWFYFYYLRAFLFKTDTGVLRVSHNYTNNLKIDIVDVGLPTSSTSMHRGRRHRFRGCECGTMRKHFHLDNTPLPYPYLQTLFPPLRPHRARVISRTQREIFRSSSACYFAL